MEAAPPGQRAGRAGTEELRRANLSAVLRAVHVRGAMTRAQLTRELGLNRSTVGGLTSELMALGLVEETVSAPQGRARSGRPSHLVVPRPDNAVLAVDLGVDRVEVALVGLGGTIVDRRGQRHHRGEHDVNHVAETIAQMVEQTAQAAARTRFLGVGVSVPGAVRSSDGLVQFAPNLGWHEEPFTELLSQRLGLDVRTGNDANLGVLAEHLRGAAAGHEHAAYLSASVGIGGGFLVGGTLLAGAGGFAGEVGHLQVETDGETCRCGGAGCWEMKVGENHLLTLAGRLPGGGPEAVAEVLASAEAGEARAEAAVHEVARWLGVGLRSIINLFNPEVIVLGGSLALLWDAVSAEVEDAVRRNTLLSPPADAHITAAQLGQDSSLIGAAELAFETFLADPQRLAAAS